MQNQISNFNNILSLLDHNLIFAAARGVEVRASMRKTVSTGSGTLEGATGRGNLLSGHLHYYAQDLAYIAIT